MHRVSCHQSRNWGDDAVAGPEKSVTLRVVACSLSLDPSVTIPFASGGGSANRSLAHLGPDMPVGDFFSKLPLELSSIANMFQKCQMSMYVYT